MKYQVDDCPNPFTLLELPLHIRRDMCLEKEDGTLQILDQTTGDWKIVMQTSASILGKNGHVLYRDVKVDDTAPGLADEVLGLCGSIPKVKQRYQCARVQASHPSFGAAGVTRPSPVTATPGSSNTSVARKRIRSPTPESDYEITLPTSSFTSDASGTQQSHSIAFPLRLVIDMHNSFLKFQNTPKIKGQKRDLKEDFQKAFGSNVDFRQSTFYKHSRIWKYAYNSKLPVLMDAINRSGVLWKVVVDAVQLIQDDPRKRAKNGITTNDADNVPSASRDLIDNKLPLPESFTSLEQKISYTPGTMCPFCDRVQQVFYPSSMLLGYFDEAYQFSYDKPSWSNDNHREAHEGFEENINMFCQLHDMESKCSKAIVTPNGTIASTVVTTSGPANDFGYDISNQNLPKHSQVRGAITAQPDIIDFANVLAVSDGAFIPLPTLEPEVSNQGPVGYTAFDAAELNIFDMTMDSAVSDSTGCPALDAAESNIIDLTMDSAIPNSNISQPDFTQLSLCPFCDDPLPPFEPSAELLLQLNEAYLVTKTEQNIHNPDHRVAKKKTNKHVLDRYCRLHKKETYWIPRAQAEFWPTTINWDELYVRVIGRRDELVQFTHDLDAILKSPVYKSFVEAAEKQDAQSDSLPVPGAIPTVLELEYHSMDICSAG